MSVQPFEMNKKLSVVHLKICILLFLTQWHNCKFDKLFHAKK